MRLTTITLITFAVLGLTAPVANAQEDDGPLVAEECESGQIVDGECVGEPAPVTPNTDPAQPIPTDPLVVEDCVGALVNGECEDGPAPTSPPSDGTAPPASGPMVAEDCESGELVDGVCTPVAGNAPVTPPAESPEQLPSTGMNLNLAIVAGGLMFVGGAVVRKSRRQIVH